MGLLSSGLPSPARPGTFSSEATFPAPNPLLISPNPVNFCRDPRELLLGPRFGGQVQLCRTFGVGGLHRKETLDTARAAKAQMSNGSSSPMPVSPETKNSEHCTARWAGS